MSDKRLWIFVNQGIYLITEWRFQSYSSISTWWQAKSNCFALKVNIFITMSHLNIILAGTAFRFYPNRNSKMTSNTTSCAHLRHWENKAKQIFPGLASCICLLHSDNQLLVKPKVYFTTIQFNLLVMIFSTSF